MSNRPFLTTDGIEQITTQDVDAPTEPANVPELGTSLDPAPAHPVTARVVPTPAQASGEPLTTGAHGEEPVWEGRYSYKNFIARIVVRSLLTLGWFALAVYTWGTNHGYEYLPRITWVLGGLVLLSWLFLAWRIVYARLGHLYELTTKRLFVSTGVFRRRRDQVELLRINDIYVKQPSLFHRTFDVGTVVIESSEERFPISYLSGIDNPHEIMDVIWHHTRTERDLRSVKVHEV